MRYLLAMFCPPLALLASGKRFQAAAAAILYALAIATARSGIGVLIEFFLILWAFRVASDTVADREASAFTSTVKPIPIIRS